MATESLIFRKAKQNDLLAVLRLLAQDELGSQREIFYPNEIAPCYNTAFEEIDIDPNQALMVVENSNKIIGTCHLTFMPSLTFQGSKRMNIEAVRIDQAFRNQGIGEWMIQQSIKLAKERGCKIIQLTTNKKRSQAKKFYEKIGFQATHEGMKLFLE
jgi:N-acetylglutamate synthase-like GNAT family acetyltransferase